MQDKPLAGTTVLEYAQLVCGPYCGKLFADLGAEVIKIEDPATGDEARCKGPFKDDIPDPDNSLLFMYLNTSKKGITLDLRTPSGSATFRELVRKADILIEDSPPQATTNLGISYEILKKINPRLIVTSITPFGQTGPYANYKAYPLNTTFSGGMGYLPIEARPGTATEPVKPGGMLGEFGCGLHAATATLAALHLQQITGQGQHVDVSKQEAIVAINRLPAAQFANTGQIDARANSSVGKGDGLIRCKDGYVVISVVEAHQWYALVQLMGSPEWARTNLYDDNAERSARFSTEIKPRIEEWASQHTREDIYHKGQAIGCPVSPVTTAEDVVKSAQLKDRQFFAQGHDPSGRPTIYPGAPYKLSQTPWSLERPAPTLGQHNEMIKILSDPPSGSKSVIARGDRAIKYPLEGVRIADFTWAWAGAHATELLAMLGAEVIKIESRSRIDHCRIFSITTGEFYDDLESSQAFGDMNLGKLGVTLNLSHPKGVELARKLVGVSDVTAQNMRPGVMDRLGLGYDVLRKIKPDIIMLSSSSLGITGPHREYTGYAPNFAATSGLTHITGHPDHPPGLSGGEVDLLSAVTSAHAIITALIHRQKTGQGQHIDLSSSESISVLLGDVLMDYTVNGRSQSRRGNRDGFMAPHNCYPCRDEGKWISIAIATDEEWQALCRVAGHPEWVTDARFADQSSRWQNQTELDRLIGSWTINHSHYEIMTMLQALGVAAIPFFGSDDLCTDPHLLQRNYWVDVQHPFAGKQTVAGPPWKFSKTPAEITRHAPLMGEHNDYVLGELLGLKSAEIKALIEEQVIY